MSEVSLGIPHEPFDPIRVVGRITRDMGIPPAQAEAALFSFYSDRKPPPVTDFLETLTRRRIKDLPLESYYHPSVPRLLRTPLVLALLDRFQKPLQLVRTKA